MITCSITGVVDEHAAPVIFDLLQQKYPDNPLIVSYDNGTTQIPVFSEKDRHTFDHCPVLKCRHCPMRLRGCSNPPVPHECFISQIDYCLDAVTRLDLTVRRLTTHNPAFMGGYHVGNKQHGINLFTKGNRMHVVLSVLDLLHKNNVLVRTNGLYSWRVV